MNKINFLNFFLECFEMSDIFDDDWHDNEEDDIDDDNDNSL